MANKIQIRRDTTANWTAADPILSQGELGLDTTLNKVKIGNGTAHWSDLSFYFDVPNTLENGSHTVELNSTGGINFPTLTVPISDNANPNGIGQTLKFSDSSQQAIIFGPESTGGAPNAQRIIIQGAPGFTGTTGEGGDVYIWAGPGGSTDGQGGDIKVRAGQGNGTGGGGYLNLQAGDSGTSNGGYINIESGESNTYGSGGDITVQARSGGEITLRTRNSDETNNNWLFSADGKLQLPEGGDIVNEFGTSVLSSTDIYMFASGVIGTRGELTTLGNSMLGGFPIILDPAGESDAGLYIPSVSQQVSGTALQIKNKGAASSIVQVIGWGGVQLVTNTGLDEKVFEFGDDGKLTLPKGSVVSETSNTIAIAPPTSAAGQSLVIRPTTVAWGLAASGYIVYGSPITVSVTTIGGSSYFGTVNYTFSGCTAEQLGRALTGQITFPGGNTGNPQTITWTIPANSNITTFTLTLGSAVGVFGTDFNFELNGLPDGQFVTVTNNGITNSEFSHVHLVAGNPATVDIYLGDDDQYVKIEKNAGNVVIGTNLNTHQWTFETDGRLTLPAVSLIESETSSIISVGAGLAELETTYTDLMLTLNDIFTEISSESGYPWGITLPLSVPLTYNQLINLPPDTFTSQAYATTVAHNANTAYNVWQDAAATTNIHVNVSNKSWMFGNDGKLTLPSGNAQIVAESNGGVRIGTANTNVAPNAQIRIGGADHVFEIFGGPPAYSWKFEADGKLKLPGTSYASTSQNYIHAEYGIGLHPTHNTGGTGPELYISYNDGILIQPFTNDYFRAGGTTASPLFINGSDLPNNDDSIGKIPGDVYIESGTNYQDSTHGKVVVKSGTNQWKFNSNGTLTLPTGSVPAHSYGAVGDTAGMLAVDATYIYYCTANFDVETPAADIWKRTAHGTGTW